MNAEEFRARGHEMIDYIANFLETDVHQRPILSQVSPGYLRDLLPRDAPQKPETFPDIMQDFERMIMPGITQWQAQGFLAYYPARTSYASILGDLLSSAINPIGFSWAASPACTELEMGVLDWLGKAVGLPAEFLFESEKGGGVIQSNASEATLTAILAARTKVVNKYKKEGKSLDVSTLVCYSSKEAHSSFEKAGLIAGVQVRLLEPDDLLALTPETLQAAMDADRAAGFIPIFVMGTSGTTSTCAFDPVCPEYAKIAQLAQVCHKETEHVWLHVDAAYAGSALLCPEFRHLFEGIELAVLVNFDCSPMWVKNKDDIIHAFNTSPEYLPDVGSPFATDYRHWHIPLGRRFRSLKLWFTLRLYGIEGLQQHIRTHIHYAQLVEKAIIADPRLEVTSPRIMGLVCFCVKGNNEATKAVMDLMNASGKVYVFGLTNRGLFYIRIAIANIQTEDFIFEVIRLVKDCTDAVVVA